ncbi:MAG: putative zinc-binding metallopeptidase [Patescibacteria group bacterium]
MKNWSDFQKGSKEHHEEEEPLGEDERITKAENETLVPIDGGTLLPHAATSNPLVVRRQREEMNRLYLSGGYCGALDEVRQAEKTLRPADESSDVSQQGIRHPPPTENLPAICAKANEMMLAHGGDALEEERIRRGLDELRAKVLESLKGRLSHEDGLNMLNRIAIRYLGIQFNSIEEANRHLPHITMTELSMFPLLEDAPISYIAYGTDLSSPATEKFREDTCMDKQEGRPKNRIPQQLGATSSGIAYVLDNYTFRGISEFITTDPYKVLGLTGVEDVGMEHVDFSNMVQKQIEALIPLSITNARLFERVWHESRESLQVGMGQIAKLALAKIKDMAEPFKGGLEDEVANLTSEESSRYTSEKNELLSNVIGNMIYDPVRSTVLRSDEIIRLIGILSRVPTCLADGSFNGFLVPYGTSVRFFSKDGTMVEECPLSAFHARSALLSIQTEFEDCGKENRTVAHIFDILVAEAQEKILQQYQDDRNAKLSTIEEAMIDAWLHRGVNLQALPVSRLEATTWTNVSNFGQDIALHTSMKMGAQEARQYERTAQLLERPFFSDIETIRKEQVNVRDFVHFTTGQITQGTYDSAAKLMTLYEPAGFYYSDTHPRSRAERTSVMLHECAEALWQKLSDEQHQQWSRLSWSKDVNWSKEPRAKVQRHFLTHYSQTDPKEDFCDHFACYVLHAPEFRKRAQGKETRTILACKYRFISEAVASVAGREIEYPKLIPWTIEEVDGSLQREIQRVEEDTAVEMLEKNAYSENKGAREYVYEIRKSFEELLEEEEASVREEEEDLRGHEKEEEEEDFYDGESVEEEIAFFERRERIRRIAEILIDISVLYDLDRQQREEITDVAEEIESILSNDSSDEDKTILIVEELEQLFDHEEDIEEVAIYIIDSVA